MLSKYRFLATLLLLTLLPGARLTATEEWQPVTFSSILNFDTYLSRERWRIKPAHIQVVDPSVDNGVACFSASFEKFLTNEIQAKPLKVKFIKPYVNRELEREGQIKFNKTQDLSLFLLQQGWAKVTNNETAPASYHEMQYLAQKERRGVWGECDNWYKLRERQRLKGKTRYLKKNLKHYLTASSTGWVKKVLTPERLEMADGQKIKLQAVKTPNEDSVLSTCWSALLVQELEKLVLGKKVRLEGDQRQLTPTGRYLQRYVWLEGNRWQSPLHINHYLIAQNWAQLEASELNLKYVDDLKSAAKKASLKATPPIWWQQCADQVVALETASVEVLKPEFDTTCPIKGNVAGSKKNPKKTYHTPASGWYKRIEAEECFVDEASAEAAGFAKVK